MGPARLKSAEKGLGKVGGGGQSRITIAGLIHHSLGPEGEGRENKKDGPRDMSRGVLLKTAEPTEQERDSKNKERKKGKPSNPALNFSRGAVAQKRPKKLKQAKSGKP